MEIENDREGETRGEGSREESNRREVDKRCN